MDSTQFIFMILATVFNFQSTQQITVSFGINEGPISTPATPVAPIYNRNARKVPAPVFETPEDIPNPIAYKPLIPREYRAKILSFTPNPKLILGTPLDQKYTLNYEKYNLYEKQQALGKDYRGPHVFDKQGYELLRKSIKTAHQKANPNSQSFVVKTPNAEFYQNVDVERRTVPEIGIIYSSGVRYYIPQVVYYGESEEDLNSVYDKNDVKYDTKQ